MGGDARHWSWVRGLYAQRVLWRKVWRLCLVLSVGARSMSGTKSRKAHMTATLLPKASFAPICAPQRSLFLEPFDAQRSVQPTTF